MYSKDYYLKSILRNVFYYNESWGDKYPNSELFSNPEAIIPTLGSYCDVIIKSENDEVIRTMIKEIIKLVCGDMRIIRSEEEANKIREELGGERTCCHCHATKNGLIYIESEPKTHARYIINDLKDLEVVLKSEKMSKNLTKFEGKWYDFPGYEDGSDMIYISKINFDGNKFTFTGGRVFFSTVNNYGDGVQVKDVEDKDFDKLIYGQECKTPKDVEELLKGKEMEFSKVINEIKNTIPYWFSNKDFMRDFNKRSREKSSNSGV